MNLENPEALKPEPNAETGSFPVVPQPDPGNSPPENWTEPLSEAEQQEVKDRLAEEAAASEAGRAEADFEVLESGDVVQVDKAGVTVSFVEPQEATDSGSGSPSN